MTLRTTCILCGFAALDSVFDFGRQPVAGYLERSVSDAWRSPRHDLRLAICGYCRLLQQQNDAANTLLVERVYGQYQPTYTASKKLSTYMLAFVERAIRMSGARPGDLAMEIGSNDGGTLEILQKRGLRAVGVEPSGNLAESSRARGFTVRQEFFDEASARGLLEDFHPAKLLVTRHTLEHSFEPAVFLRAIAMLLADDGLAVIEVPHAHTQLALGHFEGLTFQHRSVFSVSSLWYGLEQAGLVAVDVQLTMMDGGSIVVIARRAGQNVERLCNRVERMLAMEATVGVKAGEFYARHQARFDQLKQDTRDLLARCAADGVVVVGYGAGGKGQALINMLGLGPEKLQKVIDDVPGNAGRYVPGAAIEVVRSDDPSANRASVVLITAPTHVDEIMRKERARLERGVQFLVTSPSLHVAPLDSLLAAGDTGERCSH